PMPLCQNRLAAGHFPIIIGAGAQDDTMGSTREDADMLQFAGERELKRSPKEEWEKLRDARFLASCVPDVEKIVSAEPELAVCRIKPALAFITGSLDLTIRVVESVPHSSIRIEQTTKGIANSSTVETSLQLSPSGEGTRLSWSAQVKQMGG